MKLELVTRVPVAHILTWKSWIVSQLVHVTHVKQHVHTLRCSTSFTQIAIGRYALHSGIWMLMYCLTMLNLIINITSITVMQLNFNKCIYNLMEIKLAEENLTVNVYNLSFCSIEHLQHKSACINIIVLTTWMISGTVFLKIVSDLKQQCYKKKHVVLQRIL